jgi:hypothetical protein
MRTQHLTCLRAGSVTAVFVFNAVFYCGIRCHVISPMSRFIAPVRARFLSCQTLA